MKEIEICQRHISEINIKKIKENDKKEYAFEIMTLAKEISEKEYFKVKS